MKHLSALLLFAALFNCTAAFTQNNKVTLGVIYLPTCDYGAAYGSLGYFRTLGGRHSVGVKTLLNTNAFEVPKNQIRDHFVSTDIVHRWSSRGAQWHVEAGISVRSKIERIPANRIVECGVGWSEEKLRTWEAYNSSSHTNVTFRSGIATAAGWEYPLTRHFDLGLGITANLYFSANETPEILTLPTVNASYRF